MKNISEGGRVSGVITAGSQHHERKSDWRNHYCSQSEKQLETSENQESEEPEPQDEVDLKQVEDCDAVLRDLTFSLTMFNERMQRLLNFCSPAPVPTE